MIVYFDKFYLDSRSASALLLKDRVKKDGFEDIVVFCTRTVYKGTYEEDAQDYRVKTSYLFSFNSTLRLYLGFCLFMIVNNRNVDRVISFSSPGFNILFHGYSFWASRTTYVIQDLFPENIGLIFPLFFSLRHLWRPIFKLSYQRIGTLETISSDMAQFLKNVYKVEVKIRYNTNPYPTSLYKSEALDLWQNNRNLVFGYSGNFSNSHGIIGPKNLFEVLVELDGVDIKVRGFGKYFDFLSKDPNFLGRISFGGSMGSREYQDFLRSLDVLLLFQEDGYEKVCLSCKFNTVIELGKPILYIGPQCDISRYIILMDIGIHIYSSDTKEIIKDRLLKFIDNLPKYQENANRNESFELNEVLS